MAGVSEYTKSYSSFSGVDITATFQGKVIGSLQGVSYSITREKAPIYTMGSANPRSFSRGKRGIAGGLVFTVFDRSALLATIQDLGYGEQNVDQFYAYKSDKQHFDNTVGGAERQIANISSGMTGLVDSAGVVSPRDWSTPYYTDQIPPFDIVLSAANEFGSIASMSIVGVDILNEGSGMSIDDIVTEEQFTFVCREIKHWKSHNAESTFSPYFG